MVLKCGGVLFLFCRQAGRQMNTMAARETNRQTTGQTDREVDRESDILIGWVVYLQLTDWVAGGLVGNKL